MAIKILSVLDTAKTQYYHFKAIIIAGMGMFTDAYDLFCIPPIMKLIGRVYGDYSTEQRRYEVTPAVACTMMGIALLGTALGQLVVGRLGDSCGRRTVYGITLILMVFSSFGCGFSVCTSRTCVLLSLGFFRFLLGLGIGGDYPLSATIMSEFSNKNTRGAFIAAVFSMQGFGILVSSTVTMVVCAVFNRASHFPSPPNDVHGNYHTPESADLAWRIILMIGAIPAGLTFYWRMSMPETPRYTALVEKNVLQATKDMQKVLDMSPMIMSTIPEEEETKCFSHTSSSSPSAPPPYDLCSKEFFRRHGRDLFACSLSWFLVDIVFYSSNLFQSQIYKQSLPKRTVNAYEEAFHVAKLQAILAVCSTIPGYFATVYFIDRIGRVKIQMLGFFSVAICLFAIGVPYYTYWTDDDDGSNGNGGGSTNVGFMVLYGLVFFFSNFGPNTTTFIVPAELFPARFRSTCHGISGAFGKIGAIIGSVGFLWASHDRKMNGYSKGIGMMATLMLLAGVSMLGMITTFLFTRETKGRSLEENENEDQSTDSASDFFVRGFTDCNFIRPKISIRNEDASTV